MRINFKIQNFAIMKEQYLTEVLPVIPSNVILDKTITGCGATTSEIRAGRHSIIVIPNLPGIHSKINDPEYSDANILGVYEGIKASHIMQYLQKSLREGKRIKILATPESFKKVVDALSLVSIDITTDCFLLYDETQNSVKDCDYRGGITLPMDLFFKCQNKAMVSATPIISLSDPRFQGFQILKIVPEYNYRKNLTLYTTNNIIYVVCEEIEKLKNEEKPLFIFLNSTDHILGFMEKLEIMKDSAVFCAQKSVDKLNDKGFNYAYTEWKPERMKHINWLTSRSYSSFDIKLEVQPNVLLISDVHSRSFTMFDPNTDSVQAIGRFRNGVSSIFHISNWNSNYPLKDRDGLYNALNILKDDYYKYKLLFENAVDKSERDAYYDILTTHPFKRFINEWEQIDYFLIDNYVDEEMTMSVYHGWQELEMAYRKTGHFIVKHYVRLFPYGDIERLKLDDKQTKVKEKMKIIVEILKHLGKAETELAIEFRRDLLAKNELIVKAYDLLGINRIEELNYSRSKMSREVIIEENKKKASSANVIKLVHRTFVVGRWYSSEEIKEILSEIYIKLNIPTPPAVTAGTINKFFETSSKPRRSNERGCYLIRRR